MLQERVQDFQKTADTGYHCQLLGAVEQLVGADHYAGVGIQCRTLSPQMNHYTRR